MTDYFDRLELELRAATLRGAPARRRSLPRIGGGIARTFALAAAAAVVVVAIVALGHSHKPSAAPAATNSPFYRVCFPTKHVACLTDNYGVLSRPSVGARPAVPGRVVPSMWFGGQAVHQTHVRLLPQFNRAVRIGATETILFIAHSSLGPPNYYLGAFFVAGGKATFVQTNWPFLPAPRSTHPPDTRWVLSWSYTRWIRGYDVTVVPNQVKRVRWTVPARGATPARSVYATVHDNVAVAYVGPRAGSSLMTEYGRGSRVVAVQYQLPNALHARPVVVLPHRLLPHLPKPAKPKLHR
jgi:hypothetical protein